MKIAGPNAHAERRSGSIGKLINGGLNQPVPVGACNIGKNPVEDQKCNTKVLTIRTGASRRKRPGHVDHIPKQVVIVNMTLDTNI